VVTTGGVVTVGVVLCDGPDKIRLPAGVLDG